MVYRSTYLTLMPYRPKLLSVFAVWYNQPFVKIQHRYTCVTLHDHSVTLKSGIYFTLEGKIGLHAPHVASDLYPFCSTAIHFIDRVHTRHLELLDLTVIWTVKLTTCIGSSTGLAFVLLYGHLFLRYNKCHMRGLVRHWRHLKVKLELESNNPLHT